MPLRSFMVRRSLLSRRKPRPSRMKRWLSVRACTSLPPAGLSFEHAMDHPTIELPWGRVLELPTIALPGGYSFQITRFMVMEVIAAGLILLIMLPLARHVAKRHAISGEAKLLHHAFNPALQNPSYWDEVLGKLDQGEAIE